MSVTKLIRDRTAILSELDKRFKDTPTAAGFQKQIDGVNDQQEARIEARIAGLETEKATAVARYDAAIKTEREALAEIKKRRINPGGNPTPKAPVKPTRGGSAVKVEKKVTPAKKTQTARKKPGGSAPKS